MRSSTKKVEWSQFLVEWSDRGVWVFFYGVELKNMEWSAPKHPPYIIRVLRLTKSIGMKAIKRLEYPKYLGRGAEQAKSLAAVGLRYLL